MNNFLLSTASQQEIQSLDNKIHETVETINSLKTSREFFLSFAKDPQLFINKWLQSQSRDLKTMTDVTGNPEEERRVDFYYQPWVTEAVCRSVLTRKIFFVKQRIRFKNISLYLRMNSDNLESRHISENLKVYFKLSYIMLIIILDQTLHTEFVTISPSICF